MIGRTAIYDNNDVTLQLRWKFLSVNTVSPNRELPWSNTGRISSIPLISPRRKVASHAIGPCLEDFIITSVCLFSIVELPGLLISSDQCRCLILLELPMCCGAISRKGLVPKSGDTPDQSSSSRMQVPKTKSFLLLNRKCRNLNPNVLSASERLT